MSLNFDPDNLFPLLSSIEGTYQEAKEHSRRVDEFLGFQIERVEKELQNKYQNEHEKLKREKWIGLEPGTLQTPYTEIRFILSKLKLNPNDQVVDFGAAYGRMGLVMSWHYPEIQFLGFEVVPERAEEANRIYIAHQLKNAFLTHEDITRKEFVIPSAQAYFLYDFSANPEQLEYLLEKLKAKARDERLLLIARGRGIRHLIDRSHPWLVRAIEPGDASNFCIYRS